MPISKKSSLILDASGNSIEVFTSAYLGFKPTDTNLATKLQTFLNSVAGEVAIDFGVGKFNFDANVIVAQSGIHIYGKGPLTTQFNFSTSVDGEFLTFSKGASIIYNCSLKDLSIYTANTTNSKTAIALKDVSLFTLSHVNIIGFKGKDSHGLRVYGRENSTFEKVRISDTDICIRFSPNTNTTEWLSVDHFVLRDTYLSPTSAASAGGTIPTTSILLDSKAMVSGFTMEGRNAWVGGERGFYNNDTTSTMASYMLEIANCRREQPSSTAYSAIHIERTAVAGKMQSVRIKNFYEGVGQKGIYLRGVDFAAIENTTITDSTYTAYDVDNCTSIEWNNVNFSTTNSALFVQPNMELVRGVQKIDANIYPRTASFNKKQAALYQQRPLVGMNGAYTWEYAGDLADSTTLQLPFNTTNGYKLAIVDVAVLATDGTISEQGSFTVAAIAGVAQSGSITATTSSPTVTITGGTFSSTLAGKYLYIGEVSAGLVSTVAGDGLSLTLSANSAVAATSSTNWHGIAVNDTVRGIKKISGSAGITNANTAGKFMLWCNGATPMVNNVYFYNRLGKTVSIVAKATFI